MIGEDDLRVFAAVVEHGGFASTARTLGTTRSAVLRRIERLERRLGVRLFDRTTRQISRTDAGDVLYRRAVHILAEISEAELVVSEFSAEPQGVLRVTCPIMIGHQKLIPLLPEFLMNHKLVKIQLSLSDDVIDQSLTHHDVALRWGEQEDSTLVVTRLGESHQVVCAAPSYLERHGTPSTPEDLFNHNCLMMNRLGLDYNEWTFRYSEGNRSIRTTGNFVVNGGSGHYEALISGLGIGRITDLRGREDIASGRLRRILQDFEPLAATPIYAAHKSSRLIPPKVRAFVTYLQRRMRH
ncbi:LysR family transcriptional regulator [Methylobacterium soli]|uniref:LysR family transcriptional regulator n=1 Tax=Methylobacterium soli TaxID=553447 RepID=UPI00177C8906|nr:LysR family transcriptional regulator [Methylobacterium soli]GJE42966.1 HTH-type transcriptional regulator DmlR [Methylobacterium soli]